MKKVSLVLGLVASFFVLSVSMAGFAQTTPDVSGSKKSTDFQASNNPQNNVGTGIQTTNNNLQPTPGQSNFSQTALSGSTDLQVAGSESKPNPNTTSTTNASVRYPVNFTPYIVIGLLTLAGILNAVLQPSTKKTNQPPVISEAKPEVVSISPKKAKKKSSKKKSSAAKRKK